ncbi:MAG: LacI family DNA-binding transcriptional regulator, partial [Clostridiales bacterium]|nr:LacI family DNA-binding transcriptional regulator [Clostridiales bacterium]
MTYPVTLKDIAKEAGVSVTTVCRALQNKAEISEITKERIKELAGKHGYQPNAIARSLRLRQMRVLGILIPDNSNPYFARLIKGVEETARKNDYTVIVANTNENAAVEQTVITTLINLRVAGLMAVPVNVKNYVNLKLPLFFLSRFKRNEGYNSFNYVINDDLKGSYLATSHLAEKGKKNIYFVNGPKNSPLSLERMEGYIKALSDAGIDPDDKKVIFGNITMEDGYN